MIYKNTIITLMTIFSFMSVGWGQDINETYLYDYGIENYYRPNRPEIITSRLLPPCDEGYTEIDSSCYYQSDLDVLQQFIDNSQEGGNPPPSDLSPIELGVQGWEDGRLVELCSSNFEPFSDWDDNCYTEYCLYGEIPEEIGVLINLYSLELYGNQLSGYIPDSLGNLTNLNRLDLFHNDLSGEIPNNISDLINLTVLVLYGNNLSGEIPESIGNLTSLNYLYLDHNQFSGNIPENIGNLNLFRLYLNNNDLSGNIPESFGNLTNLSWLNLFGNQLIGNIPDSFINLTNLSILKLHDNQFSGNIPENICNLTNLIWSSEYVNYSYSYIYNNQFCPPYPECIEDYVGYQDTSECYECSFVPGDLNNDLTLNIIDVVLMVECILDDYCNECSDINDDGTTDVIDITVLVDVIINN